MLTDRDHNKLQEIIDDCQKYVDKHHKMPPSFNLTDKEYQIYLKARQQGIRLTVVCDCTEKPIPLKRGIKA